MTYGTGNGPRSVALADLDGDLDLDLAVVNWFDDNVRVLLNNSDGTFAAGDIVSVGDKPRSVAASDLDGDLDQDLVVANGSDGNVSVLTNSGNGTFASEVTYLAGVSPTSMAIADLDGDNDLDVVVTNSTSGDVSVFRNHGDGTFADATTHGAGAVPKSDSIGDLDGDLDLDLCVANENSLNISLLFNECMAVTSTIAPDSFLVTRGTYVSGGVSELAESDNLDLSLRRANADIQSRTEFGVMGFSPVANPASLDVSLEGSVFARSQVNQTIELFNYIAGSWEQVDSRLATRFTDSTVTVSAAGDLSRYVEAGTMRIQARVRYQSPIARQQFSSNTDQFAWTIGQ